jgi:hypothetical protein
MVDYERRTICEIIDGDSPRHVDVIGHVIVLYPHYPKYWSERKKENSVSTPYKGCLVDVLNGEDGYVIKFRNDPFHPSSKKDMNVLEMSRDSKISLRIHGRIKGGELLIRRVVSKND